jgi:dolichol-phosphate mannosyltransferase
MDLGVSKRGGGQLMSALDIGKGAVVCIPTYNERENIERIVPAVLEQAPGANVLVVDDNSPDGTGAIADRIAARDQRVNVLHREEKQGLGRAYLSAFKWALDNGYRYTVEFDADFSHNPRYLPEMLERLKSADVVVGSRRVKGGGVENWSAWRRFLSWGGSVYAKTVLQVPVRDLTGGFNGFHSHCLEAIDYKSIRSTGYAFQIEIKYRCIKEGLKVVEMPIVFPDRAHGVSKMSTDIMFEAMAQVLKLRLGRL